MPSKGGHSSSHHRRHGGHSSGLGGSSPRKRRTESAVKTLSPTTRSPERKNIGWDLISTGMENISSTSVLTNFQLPDKTMSSNSQELPTASPIILNVTKLLSGASQNAISMIKKVPIGAIQLTQATQTMGRLYLENVPPLASENGLMECLNDFLLSMGVTHIQGMKPCISCSINKEKGQAVVEFLAPEDASSALSFDGGSFSGSILKIRRPKDFIEPTKNHFQTGAPEKPVASADAISDIINHSPQKIFVGGVPRAISSNIGWEFYSDHRQEFMKIASAFGHLKGYRFQVDKYLNEPVAFLEYVDQSITLKACAGLSGMKLGGQALTAVQAFTCASTEETSQNIDKLPFYGVPEHAKPLLEKPTKVLKLKNAFKPEDLSFLSGLKLEETLEDIRLECARFGTVKSVNIVRNSSTSEKAEVTVEADTIRASQYQEGDDETEKTESIEANIALNSGVNSMVEPADNDIELHEVGNAGNNCTSEDNPASDTIENKSSEPVQLDDDMAFVEAPCQPDTDGTPQAQDMVNHQSEFGDNDKGIDVLQALEASSGNDLMVEEELGLEEAIHDKLQESTTKLNGDVAMESGNLEEGDGKQKASDLDGVFEHGSVPVEYLRAESSCMAAHCLHGRLYGGRFVAMGYISHDLYLARFPK
ncbi:hypothetical protein NE237_011037 [Protea cynaroides]|uniref:RRM domain-containing protein n=1 Tax=Protea cynaroides TaxID=273540 RepID=A0A9Q0GVB7_9MAGN|nr:hypothetical protein NE237_011037 [Protea cynaroides]